MVKLDLHEVWMAVFMSDFGPSVDDQAVSLSDDGTTIIIEPYNQTEPAL
jgi:hypothetical protein